MSSEEAVGWDDVGSETTEVASDDGAVDATEDGAVDATELVPVVVQAPSANVSSTANTNTGVKIRIPCLFITKHPPYLYVPAHPLFKRL